MADIDSVLATPTVGGAAASPAKKKVTKTPSKSIKPKKTTSNHPATGEMVVAAIKSLKERGGSSLQAIKKQIATTYKVDVSKLSPFIKKFIKNAVVSGKLVQTKGKGASGSFKLAVSAKEQKEGKKLKVAKTSKTTKPKPKTIKAKSTEKKKTDKKPKKSLEKKSKKTPLKKPAPKKAASKPKETAKAKPAAKKAVKPTAKKVSKKPAAGTPKKSKK